ncbi:vWA domain-containing protein [Planctomycetes bacterium K23_9]|uniref:von Willebrand factor type A domain protein n=1 Tax=Stieleria marina TaxID=1930275 RepID=A0A517NQ44_9BACT|nr:von Willebrand factor type A domain protein [Planctomycetes bacterium K23_9]
MNRSIPNRRGSTMVFVVIMLPIIFALAGMAVNYSYIQVCKTKMQIVADASVRAAGREYVDSGDRDLALAAAQNMSNLNPVGTTTIALSSGDLEFGSSYKFGSNQKYSFNPTTGQGNAVRLTTNTFAGGGGDAPIPFFAVLGSNFEIRPTLTATNTQSTLDVALVVDRSGSMRSPADPAEAQIPGSEPDDVPLNSRWLDLVDAVDIFLNELNSSASTEKASLVSYSDNASDDVNLSSNYSAIRSQMDAFSDSFPGGYTNIHEGIMFGINSVTKSGYSRSWATRAIVLMSDGNATAGDDPLLAAAQAASLEIPIYTVSFSQEADQILMEQIAADTGGRHFHADTGAQLEDAFRSIAQAIPSLLTQ